ncbi:MAG: hypothetical protein OSA98_21195 [Rubripirellula sp.]|nr:hypothetical protein [Rubripirellula sp.]
MPTIWRWPLLAWLPLTARLASADRSLGGGPAASWSTTAVEAARHSRHAGTHPA